MHPFHLTKHPSPHLCRELLARRWPSMASLLASSNNNADPTALLRMRARQEHCPHGHLETCRHLRPMFEQDEELKLEVSRKGYEDPIATGAIPINGGMGYKQLFDREHALQSLLSFPLPLAEWTRCCMRITFREQLLWLVVVDGDKHEFSPAAPFFRPFEGEERWKGVVKCRMLYCPGAPQLSEEGNSVYMDYGSVLDAVLSIEFVLPALTPAPEPLLAPLELEEVRHRQPLAIEALSVKFLHQFDGHREETPIFASCYHFLKALRFCQKAAHLADEFWLCDEQEKFQGWMLVFEVLDEEGQVVAYAANKAAARGHFWLPPLLRAGAGRGGAVLQWSSAEWEELDFTAMDLEGSDYRVLLVDVAEGEAHVLTERSRQWQLTRSLAPAPRILFFRPLYRDGDDGAVRVSLEARAAPVKGGWISSFYFNNSWDVVRCLHMFMGGALGEHRVWP